MRQWLPLMALLSTAAVQGASSARTAFVGPLPPQPEPKQDSAIPSLQRLESQQIEQAKKEIEHVSDLVDAGALPKSKLAEARDQPQRAPHPCTPDRPTSRHLPLRAAPARRAERCSALYRLHFACHGALRG